MSLIESITDNPESIKHYAPSVEVQTGSDLHKEIARTLLWGEYRTALRAGNATSFDAWYQTNISDKPISEPLQVNTKGVVLKLKEAATLDTLLPELMGSDFVKKAKTDAKDGKRMDIYEITVEGAPRYGILLVDGTQAEVRTWHVFDLTDSQVSFVKSGYRGFNLQG